MPTTVDVTVMVEALQHALRDVTPAPGEIRAGKKPERSARRAPSPRRRRAQFTSSAPMATHDVERARQP